MRERRLHAHIWACTNTTTRRFEDDHIWAYRVLSMERNLFARRFVIHRILCRFYYKRIECSSSSSSSRLSNLKADRSRSVVVLVDNIIFKGRLLIEGGF